MEHKVTLGRAQGIGQPARSAEGVLPRLADGTAIKAAALTAPVILILFMLSVVPPSFFFIGELRFSFTRLLLLVLFVPLLVRLLIGRAGPIRAIDIFMMLFMLWVVVTLLFNHGTARLPLAGITIVETFGAYLVGRTLVRTAADLRLLYRTAFWVMVFLSPFVLLELLTDRNLLQELSRTVFSTYVKARSSYGRLGLNRVMAGFEHPILYGLFCATAFAPLLALHRGGFPTRVLLAGFVCFMTFASLSSAPLLAVALQVGLLIWAWVTGGRWWLLTGILAIMYVGVDLLSDRTPITILINYISFNPATAWTRVNIWLYGSAEMWRHPIFGIGLNDWQRPNWLTGSVDNFWLLNGMRHGALGLFFLLAAVVTGLWAVMHAKGLAGEAAKLRLAYVLSLLALYFTLCTVHVWGGTGSFAMMLIGAGMWFCDARNDRDADVGAAEPDPAPDAPRTRYSRFSNVHVRPSGRGFSADLPNIPKIAPIPTPQRRTRPVSVAAEVGTAASRSPTIPNRR